MGSPAMVLTTLIWLVMGLAGIIGGLSECLVKFTFKLRLDLLGFPPGTFDKGTPLRMTVFVTDLLSRTVLLF